MNEIRVRSWTELLDQLYLDSWKESIGRFRSSFAYRGVSTATCDLTTSLIRLGGQPDRIEGHLLRNFRKYAIQESNCGRSTWSWLALAQHHGLPTRLLDWTYSPLVAMHFATAGEWPGEDALIWCVDFVAAHRLLPRRLRTVLEREGSDVFTVDMLDTAAPSLTRLDALARQPFVVFLEPPSLDARIINQSALFALLSSPSASMHDWLATHPALYRRILIPAALRREVRDKLDQANITERVLFPGLDGLSSWLRRYYQPGNGNSSRTAPEPSADDPFSLDAALVDPPPSRRGSRRPERDGAHTHAHKRRARKA